MPAALALTTHVAPGLPPVTTATTAARELAFVVTHAVHHNAILGIMVRLLGAEPPAGFGYAPATVAHHRSRACVR